MAKGIVVAVIALAGLGMAWAVAVGGVDTPAAESAPARCTGVMQPGTSC